jgi:hypothetical protein
VPNDTTPATVVILAHISPGITDDAFESLAEGVRRTGVAVTWVADPDCLARLARNGDEWGWALALDDTTTSSRQRLRHVLASLRRTSVDAVVVPEGGVITHRELLVEAGIHTAVVDRFDDVPRGSRRPAPEGWACRSIVWGLWEVESTPATSGSLLSRWMPWIGGPPAGSLAVVTVSSAETASRPDVDRTLRIIAAQRTGRIPKRYVRLGDLPAQLGSGGQTHSASVLRAA